MRIKLRQDWYSREIPPDFDLHQPGVYEWRIDGLGVYVGRAKNLHKRIAAYPNNLRSMLEGKPWHGDPTKEYRIVHDKLHDAYNGDLKITVAVLGTCNESDIAALERLWIRRRREEEAEGGPRVLNAT